MPWRRARSAWHRSWAQWFPHASSLLFRRGHCRKSSRSRSSDRVMSAPLGRTRQRRCRPPGRLPMTAMVDSWVPSTHLTHEGETDLMPIGFPRWQTRNVPSIRWSFRPTLCLPLRSPTGCREKSTPRFGPLLRRPDRSKARRAGGWRSEPALRVRTPCGLRSTRRQHADRATSSRHQERWCPRRTNPATVTVQVRRASRRSWCGSVGWT